MYIDTRPSENNIWLSQFTFSLFCRHFDSLSSKEKVQEKNKSNIWNNFTSTNKGSHFWFIPSRIYAIKKITFLVLDENWAMLLFNFKILEEIHNLTATDICIIDFPSPTFSSFFSIFYNFKNNIQTE